MNIFFTMFGWPNGIVVGNLIASAIWSIPTTVLLIKHHGVLKELKKLHTERPHDGFRN